MREVINYPLIFLSNNYPHISFFFFNSLSSISTTSIYSQIPKASPIRFNVFFMFW